MFHGEITGDVSTSVLSGKYLLSSPCHQENTHAGLFVSHSQLIPFAYEKVLTQHQLQSLITQSETVNSGSMLEYNHFLMTLSSEQIQPGDVARGNRERATIDSNGDGNVFC